MGEFLTLKDGPGQKDYGYVAKIENGRGEYGYGDIEYEIVLNGEGVISNGNWNNIVGDIKVYNMKEVDDDNRKPLKSSFNWKDYIVFVFRATRKTGDTEIEVEYVDKGVFSPPDKKEEEEKKEEKKEEEVTEIVLKAEKVDGDDNKYKLFFKFPNNIDIDDIESFTIHRVSDIDSFYTQDNLYENKYIPLKGKNNLQFLVKLDHGKIKGNTFDIGVISTTNNNINEIFGNKSGIIYYDNKNQRFIKDDVPYQ